MLETLAVRFTQPEGLPDALPPGGCVTADITAGGAAESQLQRADERLHALFTTAPMGIALTAMDGRFVEVNPAFERLLGYDAAALARMDAGSLNPADCAGQAQERLEALRHGGHHGPCEQEMLRQDGSRLPVRVSAVRVAGSDGHDYIWTLVEDLREARRSLETLQIADTLYQSSTEAILLSDPDNTILDVNPAFTRILGYTLDDVRGRNPRMFQSGLQKTAFYRELWTSLRDLGRWQGELWNRHKDGRMIALWYTISVVRDAAGAPRRYVAQFSDATDRKHHEAALWRQASFDPLTNLPNRRLFRDRLEQEVRRAQAGNHPVALIYIDLDRFKDVNEVLGHDRGDYLLMEVAVRIAACVEDRDRVGHLGGDKFAVMVAGEGPCAAVDALASRIVESLALPYDLGGPNRYHAASASAGIAQYAQGCDGVESLFKQAEQGMYEAKRLGRKRVAHFRPQMQREADEKFQLGNEMREAIEQGQLVVHYQPIVDLATRRIAKAEALVRWQHPRRGLLLPGVFVDIAEQYGLLRALGESVFQQALDTAARWQQAFGRVIPISINVSPVQMLDEAATAHWVEAIHRRGLPGSAIAIEALEAVMMQDSPVLRQRLLEFREAGIDVLIDDFGTGYSNYKRLRENHIDFLKIDRSFTRDLDSSADDRAISKAIIGMAHELGIRTIAEGVETQAVCDILQGMGCDYVQGFLFHRPLSRSDFEARIRAEAG